MGTILKGGVHMVLTRRAFEAPACSNATLNHCEAVSDGCFFFFFFFFDDLVERFDVLTQRC